MLLYICGIGKLERYSTSELLEWLGFIGINNEIIFIQSVVKNIYNVALEEYVEAW